MICATICSFKREKDSEWEKGIAICSAPGLSDVIAIIPNNATSTRDTLKEVWKYHLNWHEGTIQGVEKE